MIPSKTLDMYDFSYTKESSRKVSVLEESYYAGKNKYVLSKHPHNVLSY